MGNTSNSSKQRWNASRYSQVKVAIHPETAAAFKAACQAEHVSMARVLSGFMESRAGTASLSSRVEKDLLKSRGGRRKLLAALTTQLEEIKEAEADYRDQIPASFRESIRYDNAEQSVQAMEEALDALYEAY